MPHRGGVAQPVGGRRTAGADGDAHGPLRQPRAAPRGGVVQIDPMKPKLKAPGAQRLTLNCDEPLSSIAFKITLRRYSEGLAPLHGRACEMLLKISYDTFANPRFSFFNATSLDVSSIDRRGPYSTGTARARAPWRARCSSSATAPARSATRAPPPGCTRSVSSWMRCPW